MSNNSHEAELVRCARNIARLQAKRRRHLIDSELKLERKHIKALVSLRSEPDVMPSRTFGDSHGLKVRR